MVGLDGSKEILNFRSARGNVQDSVKGFNACNDSNADAVEKPKITNLESQVD